MAKDKSFHSAAIIVDATIDIADIVVSGGDFRSSAKRLYLLIEQAPNRSDSGNFPSSAMTDFNFKRIFTCCRITIPLDVVWKVYIIANFDLPPTRNHSSRHRRLCDINLGVFPILALAPASIRSLLGIAIILLPIINLNARCHTSIAMKAGIYTGNKISLIERINVILRRRTLTKAYGRVSEGYKDGARTGRNDVSRCEVDQITCVLVRVKCSSAREVREEKLR